MPRPRAITSIPAAAFRTRSRRRRAIRANKTVLRPRRHLSSGGAGAGADLVQRAARRHHARGRRRRHPHRRQPRGRRPRAPSYPAVVNHVVYFGDGVSRKTVLRGFKITGANNFTTGSGEQVADRIGRRAQDAVLLRGRRRHQDLRAVVSDDRARSRSTSNYTSPCGGGVSVEHLGQMQDSAGLPQLHLPQQPHADHRLRVRPAARQPRRPRELPLRRQHRQHRRGLRRDAERRRVPSRSTAPAR